MTGPGLGVFIDSLRELLEDGDLAGLGSITLRGQWWDIEEAARDLLRRVAYYRGMSPKGREALGPKTMRHQLAADLALTARDAPQWPITRLSSLRRRQGVGGVMSGRAS